jgi:hypothetical protein
MNDVLKDVPAAQEVHVIVDNYCTHKKNDDWLAAHPNVTFHFTPTSASWLNQVEIWFGILTRKALTGASFDSTHELAQASKTSATLGIKMPIPLTWRKRDVKGSQLRNTLNNLQAIVLSALHPGVLDRHVPTLDIADFAEALAERGQKVRRCIGQPAPTDD